MKNNIGSKDARQSIKNAGKALAIFAMVSGALVAATFTLTKDRIAENERQALLRNLHQLIPQNLHNNDLYTDTITVNEATLNYRNKPFIVYRARMNSKPITAIFSVTAPDGYNGAIKLLIAVNHDESIAGVRVIGHKETPGLGDAIDLQKSNWIRMFDNKSLTNPGKENWQVKKDGGYFDQLTGATITPRAIVKISKKTLNYFAAHKSSIFSITQGE